MVADRPVSTHHSRLQPRLAFEAIAPAGFPLVEPGDDLSACIVACLTNNGLSLRDKDVVIVAQKIVSKAENRYVDLATVRPSARALELAACTGKDPRFVEVVLSESRAIIRIGPNVLIAEHKLGFIMANAGIDQSNISHETGERVLCLPRDPDGFCRDLKDKLDAHFGVVTGVVMNDSFGRPWRLGSTGVALGAAGLPALVSMVGKPDLFGRTMRMTEIAVADQVAAAASLAMGETNEATPLVVISGLPWSASSTGAKCLVRPSDQDLFR